MVVRTTTVVTPAASCDLVTLDDLKTDLDITSSTDDAYLSRAISRASQAAARYCDRVLVAETVEDSFGGFDCGAVESLQLSHYPVAEMTSVTLDGRVLVQDTDYRVDLASGVLYSAAGQWDGSAVVAAYEGGYDPIPLDLQGAVTDMVKAQQFNRTRDPMLRSEDILSGLYAYTLFNAEQMPSGTADQVSSTLDSYRVVSV